MKICFYADLYFILSFVLNLFFIYVTAILRQKRYTPFRWVMISGMGAAISVVMVILHNSMFNGIFAVIQLAVIPVISFTFEGIGDAVMDEITFMAISIFTAGALFLVKEQISQFYPNNGRISLGIIFLSVFILFILFRQMKWKLIKQKNDTKTIFRATVINHGQEYQIQALYDTGNRLVSPYTGEAVMLISKKLAEKLDLTGEILIPFHSIGGDGVLSAFRIEYLKLEDGTCRRNFLAAVSDSLCADQNIQMILNAAIHCSTKSLKELQQSIAEGRNRRK